MRLFLARCGMASDNLMNFYLSELETQHQGMFQSETVFVFILPTSYQIPFPYSYLCLLFITFSCV